MNEELNKNESLEPTGSESTENKSAPEGVGMARAFEENPALEILKNRRIDQLVAKKEQERAQIAQSMKNAEDRGVATGKQEGYDIGTRKGYDAGSYDGFHVGHATGLENGLKSNQNYINGLGNLKK